MQKSERKNFIEGFLALRASKPIQLVNRFFESPLGLAFFASLTLLSFIFSLELIFYGIVIAYALYVCLFADDFFTILPLFLFCYVSPSIKNNPGRTDSSIFYGTEGLIILCLAGLAVVGIILRIALDKKMGFKRLFTQKQSLIWGLLALGLAYLLSGIGSASYKEVAGKNLLFAALQFLALFLLYFLCSGTTDWEKKDKKYLPWAFFLLGVLVAGELAHVYLTNDVIDASGAINRSRIYTGWGMWNNIGGLLALSIPFAFYLSTQYRRRGILFLPAGVLLLVATFLTSSRGSSVGATFAFLVSYIVAAIKAPKKQAFFFLSALIVLVVGIVFLFNQEKVAELFLNIPDIIASTGKGEGIKFNDSNRFDIYKEGFGIFLESPVFGGSFYSSESVWDFSTLEKFSNFFPPRWHNTIIQILASCGAVGIVAYLFHRVQTAIVFLRRPSLTKTFLGLGVLVLLLTSLLDCHMFNVGPTFFYSICLAFAENLHKCGNKKETAPSLPLAEETL